MKQKFKQVNREYRKEKLARKNQVVKTTEKPKPVVINENQIAIENPKETLLIE